MITLDKVSLLIRKNKQDRRYLMMIKLYLLFLKVRVKRVMQKVTWTMGRMAKKRKLKKYHLRT